MSCVSDSQHHLKTINATQIINLGIFQHINNRKKKPYPFQRTGLNHSLVLLRVHGLSKQDVAADGARVNPGLLRGVGQLTFDPERTLLCGQFSQDGAQQRRLREREEEAISFIVLGFPQLCRDEIAANLSGSNWSDDCQEVLGAQVEGDVLQRRSIDALQKHNVCCWIKEGNNFDSLSQLNQK